MAGTVAHVKSTRPACSTLMDALTRVLLSSLDRSVDDVHECDGNRAASIRAAHEPWGKHRVEHRGYEEKYAGKVPRSEKRIMISAEVGGEGRRSYPSQSWGSCPGGGS